MKLSNLTLQEADVHNALAFSDLISDHVDKEHLGACIKAYRELAGAGFLFHPEMMDQNPCFINEDDYGAFLVIYISPSGKEFWVHVEGEDSFQWGGGGTLKMNDFGKVAWVKTIKAIDDMTSNLSFIDNQFAGGARKTIRQTEED